MMKRSEADGGWSFATVASRVEGDSYKVYYTPSRVYHTVALERKNNYSIALDADVYSWTSLSKQSRRRRRVITCTRTST